MRQRRCGAGGIAADLRSPCLASIGLGLRIVSQRLLGRLLLGHRRIGRLQLCHLGFRSGLAGSPRSGQTIDPRLGVGRPLLEDVADFLFLGIGRQHLLALGHLFEHRAVDQLRQRDAGVLHRQPDHRNHVGHDQDDVLRDLGPGHRTHAAEERADQNAKQTDHDTVCELNAGEASSDQAHAVDLRHHVHERAQDGHQDADETGQVAAVARAQKVRDRELTELAQVRCEQERHQAVAAGPAQDEGQAVKALQVEAAGHADERGGRHPVRARGHAVEDRGHAPAGHVVLGHVGSAAHDADPRVQRDGGKQERVADVGPRQAHLLHDRQNDQEHQEAARVPRVVLLELVEERSVGTHLGAHHSSPSATP